MLRKAIIPQSYFVPSAAKKLYKLEEELVAKLNECAIEWGKLRGVPQSMLYDQLIPQAIFDLMKSHADYVGNAVVYAWQTKGGTAHNGN